MKTLLAILILMGWCVVGYAEPNYDLLADAIRIAEGNSNYGVLSHYKHTSYRQACKNTLKHAWKDYSRKGPIATLRALKGHRNGFLRFLRDRYCPVGAKNDPRGLNKNWLKNVKHHYKGDV